MREDDQARGGWMSFAVDKGHTRAHRIIAAYFVFVRVCAASLVKETAVGAVYGWVDRTVVCGNLKKVHFFVGANNASMAR